MSRQWTQRNGQALPSRRLGSLSAEKFHETANICVWEVDLCVGEGVRVVVVYRGETTLFCPGNPCKSGFKHDINCGFGGFEKTLMNRASVPPSVGNGNKHKPPELS